jgi:hypothetical protein
MTSSWRWSTRYRCITPPENHVSAPPSRATSRPLGLRVSVKTVSRSVHGHFRPAVCPPHLSYSASCSRSRLCRRGNPARPTACLAVGIPSPASGSIRRRHVLVEFDSPLARVARNDFSTLGPHTNDRACLDPGNVRPLVAIPRPEEVGGQDAALEIVASDHGDPDLRAEARRALVLVDRPDQIVGLFADGLFARLPISLGGADSVIERSGYVAVLAWLLATVDQWRDLEDGQAIAASAGLLG